MKLFSLIFLVISAVAQAQEFEGAWNLEKIECKNNGQSEPCTSSYSKIEISYDTSPEKICIQYNYVNGGNHSECLVSFDYSKPDVGVTYKAELTIYSDKTGAVYRFTDANSFARNVRAILVEKIGLQKYAVTEIIQSHKYDSNQVDRQEKVYFLSR